MVKKEPKTKRRYDTIPFAEVEPLINLVKNKMGCSEKEVGIAIGYGGSTLSSLRFQGIARRTVKYALLGLAAEMDFGADAHGTTKKNDITLSYDECAFILSLLIRAKKSQPGNEDIPRLIRRMAEILAKGE